MFRLARDQYTGSLLSRRYSSPLRARDYPLPAGYDQALRDSKRLVFEVRMMGSGK